MDTSLSSIAKHFSYKLKDKRTTGGGESQLFHSDFFETGNFTFLVRSVPSPSRLLLFFPKELKHRKKVGYTREYLPSKTVYIYTGISQVP